MINQNNEYECDDCEEVIDDNDDCVEVKYGYICLKCAGH